MGLFKLSAKKCGGGAPSGVGGAGGLTPMLIGRQENHITSRASGEHIASETSHIASKTSHIKPPCGATFSLPLPHV